MRIWSIQVFYEAMDDEKRFRAENVVHVLCSNVGAVGMYCESARRDYNQCGPDDDLWEQAPHRKGVFTRFRDWLIGES